tara:strand:- start:2009 stop:2926 length:918 start_codon:yes stop_codon:yes gene_type:complete
LIIADTQKIIEEFESGLNPNDLDASKIPAKVLGYGEISTVFQIGGLETEACKRMPLFAAVTEADNYSSRYEDYCRYLQAAGLTLTESQTFVFNLSEKPVTLYIVQNKLNIDEFAHKLLHSEPDEKARDIIESIIQEIKKVWKFNKHNKPGLELALDGQLSNWVRDGGKFVYIDTSTPLFKLEGVEQLDPELFLKSAPSFLRWMIRLFFLQEVMDRYYNLRSVFLDLAGNLYKEQRKGLIPDVLEIINDNLNENDEPLDEKEVAKYYKEDKFIWALFLALRRFDRWLHTKVFHKPYPYILPGKIKR